MSTPTLTPPSTPRAVWLVAERELRMRLRSKAFLISTGILLLIVLASIIFGGFAAADTSRTEVAATGTAIETVEALDVFDVRAADSVDAAKELVRTGEVDAAIIPSTDPTAARGLTVVALDEVPMSVTGMLGISPAVELLEPKDEGQNPFLIYIVALGFGLVFFMSAITFGPAIAQSVVEEKQTRIVEILMATVPARTLMAGKILGNTILAFSQIALISLLAGVGMLVSGQDLLLADLGPALAWFVALFAVGFVLVAAIYAATAALVSRQEDVASATAPATYLIMIPYFLIIFFQDNDFVLTIMSYVPFSAPVGMPMRVFLGTAEWWEPILSLVILAASTAVIILLGARIYENGLLRMGGRVKLKDALSS